MFDLEKSIADWRKQMLAAGIKTPVPLEELEIHLREEIEQQIQSGVNERKIFNSAVQKIGQGKVLKNEFNKAEDHNMKRAIILTTGWLAGVLILLYSMMRLDFHWDFMCYLPKWDLETLADTLIILAAETGIWFLAKASRDGASRVVSLLLCLFLAGLGIFCLFPEQRHATFVSSDTKFGAIVGEALTATFNNEPPSPLWYRGGFMLLECLPGIFWIWWAQRQMIQKHHALRKSQPSNSN